MKLAVQSLYNKRSTSFVLLRTLVGCNRYVLLLVGSLVEGGVNVQRIFTAIAVALPHPCCCLLTPSPNQ
jgi:hypothetical protein